MSDARTQYVRAPSSLSLSMERRAPVEYSHHEKGFEVKHGKWILSTRHREVRDETCLRLGSDNALMG